MVVGAVLFLGPRTSTISTLEARLSQEWITSIEVITVMFPRRARQVAVLKQRVTIPKQLGQRFRGGIGHVTSFCHLEVVAERVGVGAGVVIARRVNPSMRIRLPINSTRPSRWRIKRVAPGVGRGQEGGGGTTCPLRANNRLKEAEGPLRGFVSFEVQGCDSR